MATKYFCDKCGREKEISNVYIGKEGGKLASQELCDNCIEYVVREFKEKMSHPVNKVY
jgi:hypothetical protein